jgi:hypothetical protein
MAISVFAAFAKNSLFVHVAAIAYRNNQHA